ncbi:MAG: tyrosine-type recombinase/integrase [Anaerolineae bacterium]
MSADMDLPQYVESFFRDRLVRQIGASNCTIRAYRDGLKLLINYIAEKKKIAPHNLRFDDLSRGMVIDFLDYLERERGNSIQTRNARLAAIRSLFAHIATVNPARMASVSQITSIPSKKTTRRTIGYLVPNEIDALLATPDRDTESGRRVYVLLLFLLRTGARVSEAVAVDRRDLRMSSPYQVLIHGKGEKERCVPLSAELVSQLSAQLSTAPSAKNAVFLNAKGARLTRHGIAHLLRACVRQAVERCPSLKGRRITPHVLRHTTAMCLLRAGVDLTTIRSWLGHSSVETTHLYVEADLEMKERALAACNHTDEGFIPYRPPDDLLAFLDSL